MAPDDPIAMCSYELPLSPREPAARETLRDKGGGPLPGRLLADNALWFCRLRWGVVGILAAFGILGSIPGLLAPMGLGGRTGWRFGTAGILAAYNVAFYAHARMMKRSKGYAVAGCRLHGVTV